MDPFAGALVLAAPRRERVAVSGPAAPLDCWLEDRRLAARMLRGDQEAFDEFARDCIPVLYRYTLRQMRGDQEGAREIVQATLSVAIAKLGQFQGRAALTTWLCACGRNEIAAHHRREARHRAEPLEKDGRPLPLEAPIAGPERELLRGERAALVHRALDLLPRQYGAVLEWKYLDNLSVDEIAQRLKRGPKAAESLLTRARDAFRALYLRLLDGPRGALGEDDA